MKVAQRTPSAPPIATAAAAAAVHASQQSIAPPLAASDHGGRLFPKAPVEHTAMAPAAQRATGIENVFQKTIGKAAMAALKASFSSKPVILIAGDQLTGKSTVAKAVAAAFGGEASGTGRLMRAAADKAGKPIEEFVKSVAADFDVQLDWQATKKIASGDVSVFESRLAGHLGQMLENMGRKNVVSVYLVASPRERALRYLARELSPAVRARVEPQLVLPGDATLEQCMKAIVALNDPDANKIASQWRDIAHRDDVDQARLLDLYAVDYQDR